MTVTDTSRDWLAATLRGHVRKGETFHLAGGDQSDWYIDCRELTYGVEGTRVARMVSTELAGFDLDAVGGVGYGGVPIGILVAQRWQVRSFAVRLDVKGHGRVGKIVGPLLPGDKVALVEDVFTSGSSVCAAVEALRAYGAEVAAVVAIVNRGNPSLTTLYGDIPFRSLVTAADLGEE